MFYKGGFIVIFGKHVFSQKFLVLKWEDIQLALTRDELSELDDAIAKISKHRVDRGKVDYNKYFVVNFDEPYADKIADILIENEDIEELVVDE